MRQFQARIAMMDNIFFADNIVTVSLPVADNDSQLLKLRKKYTKSINNSYFVKSVRIKQVVVKKRTLIFNSLH